MQLAEAVLLIHRALAQARIPHAFGGAIALGFHAEPRATVDIDVNIFVRTDDAPRVLVAMEAAGFPTAGALAAIRHRGQVRLRRDDRAFDLFFNMSEFHEAVARRVRSVPWEGEMIDVLSPEDLVIFKVLFNRPRDWVDIDPILFTAGSAFDVAYVVGWIEDLMGADSPGVVHLRERIVAILGDR